MKQALLRIWLRASRRLGPAGVSGVIALLAAVGIAAALPRLHREVREATAARAAHALATQQPGLTRPVSLSPADAARGYVDGFPSLGQNAADLSRVFAAAEGRRVQLAKGEYQLKSDPNAAFVVYTATFPVHGEYDALKGFTADVLGALPHVAMDELHLTRDNAGSTTLDAVVRFTFYYRSL
jgi:hypothetical protein